ncbi:ABC transporter substrate-binding protein, partial [Bacillus cereus]
LDWFPNTNHTGLYVAQTKDYYKKQGLDVEIIQPGDNVTAEQMIASGKADFAISAQENVTLARVEGIPVVSVGAIIQHNTS